MTAEEDAAIHEKYEKMNQEVRHLIEEGIYVKRTDLDTKNDSSNLSLLKDISEKFSQFTELPYLELSYIQVGSEMDLSPFINLVSLDLMGTQINNEINLSALTKLTNLELGETKVSDGIDLTALSNLTALYLEQTKVGDEIDLSALVNLTTLSLAMTQVGNGIDLSALKNLLHLDLFATRVTKILPFLRVLPKLTYLVTCHTFLTDVPSEIHGHHRRGNSLPNLRAWQADLNHGTHHSRTFKLQICGNGTVGKTTITDRLLTGEFIDHNESTDGIQVRYSKPREYRQGLPDEESDPISFIIWDFAGQDLYHQMHRLFLRSRSVVLLVYDEESITSPTQTDRKTGGQDLNRKLSYWAQDIMANSPNSEVFLVQNKMDRPGAKRINVDDLLPANFKYHGPHYVSALNDNDRGFRRLLEDIHEVVTELPAHQMLIPESWWQVREDLLLRTEDDTRTTMSIEDFYTLCREKNLCANSESALLTYLDGLGVIIYDAKLFPDQLVLNPQWALDGIYSALQRPDLLNLESLPPEELLRLPFLLRFEQQVRENNGQFIAANLPFDKDKYSDAECNLFLKIMLRAGVCFETNAEENEEKIYVLFHLLPEDQPAEVDRTWHRCLKPETSILYQRYRNPHHLHRGIFRELVKGINDHVQLDHLWQDGLLLNYQSQTFALLTTSYADQDSHISIAATGPAAVSALQAFRNQLNRLITAGQNFQLEVSNDGIIWFTPEALQAGLEDEARFVRDVTGNRQEEWKGLTGWALARDEKINFEERPSVQHEVEAEAAQLLPTNPLPESPLDLSHLSREELLTLIKKSPTVINFGTYVNNSHANIKTQITGSTFNDGQNFSTGPPK